MLVTEHGLHFEREGDLWRCREHRSLCMSPSGGLFELDGDGRTFASLREALVALKSDDGGRTAQAG